MNEIATSNPTTTATTLNPRRVHIKHIMKKTRSWGDGHAGGSGAPSSEQRVVLTLHIQHTFQPHTLDAQQILGRALKSIEDNAVGVIAWLHVDRVDGKKRCCTAHLIAHNPEAPTIVADAFTILAQQIRDGQYDVPVVTVEQHRAFQRLGIKVRNDGLFGYKRLCAAPECKVRVEEFCFADLMPDQAIAGAEKRGEFACSAECWLDAGWAQLAGATSLVAERLQEDDIERARWVLLGAATEEPVPDALEGDGIGFVVRMADDWWLKVKADQDARLFAVTAADDTQDGADGEGPDDAVDCDF